LTAPNDSRAVSKGIVMRKPDNSRESNTFTVVGTAPILSALAVSSGRPTEYTKPSSDLKAIVQSENNGGG
jgi:hypothetical protein